MDNSTVAIPYRRSARGIGRSLSVAYWAVPSLLCLLLYWRGLQTWFQADDFGWLRVAASVHSGRDLLRALFTPMSQGTVRVLSERVFYLFFLRLFGMNPLPFHLLAWCTQCASLVLLAAIVRRITGSRPAGFLAPILWVGNSMLPAAMCWIAAYNQVLCGFCLLLSFWLLLRHFETGATRYYSAQWITFLLGFGALESMVAYPVVATAYALFAARKQLRRVLPLFAPSLIFIVLHGLVIPKAQTGPYWLDFTMPGLAATFREYWLLALGVHSLRAAGAQAQSWLPATAILLSVPIAVFLLWQCARRDWRPIYLFSWFLLLLAPVLPLSRHVMPYYLALPTLGLAMLGACAVERGWKAGGWLRVSATMLAALYLVLSVPCAVSATSAYYQRGLRIKAFVMDTVAHHRQHPAHLVAIAGMPQDVFWDGMFAKALDLYSVSDVYLMPGEEARLRTPGVPEWQHVVSEFVAPQALLREAVLAGQAAIFDASSGRLVDRTAFYSSQIRNWDGERLRRRVIPGLSLFAKNLGAGWYYPEGRYRWMSKQADLWLPGPRSPAERLYMSGYCPAARLADGPLRLTVRAEGRPVAELPVEAREAPFTYSVVLPKELVGKPLVNIGLEVDRTFRIPPDPRDLGLAFNAFEIR